jgi:hypothetical protein
MKISIIKLLVILVILSYPKESAAKSFPFSTSSELFTVPTEEEFYTKKQSDDLLPIPFVGKSFMGFKEALAFKESQRRYRVINIHGYMGKYQFGPGTLERFKIIQHQNFIDNQELQEKTFVALCQVNKWILIRDIKRMVGKKINGIPITESGILAAAHLAGAGNVKKYLRSWGQYDFKDAFGTSIEEYLIRFMNYDTTSIIPDRFPKLEV